jgi:hypothetical protein
MKKAYTENPLSHLSTFSNNKNKGGKSKVGTETDDADNTTDLGASDDIDMTKLLREGDLNKEIMRFYYMLS